MTSLFDGKLREAPGSTSYDDIGPWTGEVVAHAADGTPADMPAEPVRRRPGASGG